MTSLYVKLIVRAIMNFHGSHGYSIIKNLLALPITMIVICIYTFEAIKPNSYMNLSFFQILIDAVLFVHGVKLTGVYAIMTIMVQRA